jgi:hypothetical protein
MLFRLQGKGHPWDEQALAHSVGEKGGKKKPVVQRCPFVEIEWQAEKSAMSAPSLKAQAWSRALAWSVLFQFFFFGLFGVDYASCAGQTHRRFGGPVNIK